MNKSEWISHKIGILIKEGYKKDQAAAIAYSLWKRGDHKQEGGYMDSQTPEQQAYFKNLQAYLSQYSPALQPMPVAQQGIMLPPQYSQNVPNIGENFGSAQYKPTDYVNYGSLAPGYGLTEKGEIIPKTIPDNFQYVQGDYNLSGTADAADKIDKFGNPIQTPQYNDWVKYNIINPYRQGMDLNTRLTYTGQQFGQGHTGRGILGAGLTALGGVRSFLSGYGSGKAQQDVENQMRDRLYNNDASLYTMAQQGGITEEDLYGQDLINKYPNQAQIDYALSQPQPTPVEQVISQTQTENQEQQTVEGSKSFDKNSARDTWEKKTGLPWSEAKRLGYTDGTAKDNMKLLGELNDPRFKKENLRTKPFTAPIAQAKTTQSQAKATTPKITSSFLDTFSAPPKLLQLLQDPKSRYEDKSYKPSVPTKQQLAIARQMYDLSHPSSAFSTNPYFQEGGYTVGEEYDLTDEEIQDLINKGYKISYK